MPARPSRSSTTRESSGDPKSWLKRHTRAMDLETARGTLEIENPEARAENPEVRAEAKAERSGEVTPEMEETLGTTETTDADAALALTTSVSTARGQVTGKHDWIGWGALRAEGMDFI